MKQKYFVIARFGKTDEDLRFRVIEVDESELQAEVDKVWKDLKSLEEAGRVKFEGVVRVEMTNIKPS